MQDLISSCLLHLWTTSPDLTREEVHVSAIFKSVCPRLCCRNRFLGCMVAVKVSSVRLRRFSPSGGLRVILRNELREAYIRWNLFSFNVRTQIYKKHVLKKENIERKPVCFVFVCVCACTVCFHMASLDFIPEHTM